MEYNPSLTLQIVGGCYCRYVDKLTLAQLINSYQSHAKRRDAGMLSAATVSIGTERADHARDDPRCHTDDAREVPGSRGVVDVDKELAPAVACAVSRLLRRVGV
jgi:hypothetical protein